MNNFYRNSIRREKCGLFTKMLYYADVILFPKKAEEAWQDHCERMQRRLDNQHYKLFN